MNINNMYSASKTYVAAILMALLLVACESGSGGNTVPDTTPPVVSSTSPARGDTSFAVNSSISATFSEPMNGSTITSAVFTLSNGVTGSVSYKGTTAVFVPSGNLAFSTTYTATLTTGAKDAAGNAMAANYTWTFATGAAPDTTPPTVSSTSPARDATGLAVNAPISATFSEAMDGTSITNATFTLNNGLTGTVNYNYSSRTAVFVPSGNLAYSTTYTATLTTGAKDAAGNAMAANYTWTFNTGAAPDTTPPSVSSTIPANGATGLALNSAITATFSEPMDASTITNAIFTLNNGETGAVTVNGTTAIFTPSSNLAYSTTYTATITSGAKDASGNAMAANYTWTFTTGAAPDTTPPTVSITSPANSTTGWPVNSAITATFSETMDGATLTNAIFKLNESLTNNVVTGAVTFDYSGTTPTATFTPARNLAYLTAYTATITTGAKDAAGNAMAANYTWTFNTGTGPDSGITGSQCYEAGSDVLVACTNMNTLSLSPAQDGMLGRDVDVPNSADGKLGFSFAKVCNSGQLAGTGACPASPLLGSAANQWGCTLDNLTGLMWEVKTTDGGLRDWTKTYSKVNLGSANYGTARDASGFVSSVNTVNLCGHSDWRLPTSDELQSIVDYSVADPGPTLDAAWFPNTLSGVSARYWTATPYVYPVGFTGVEQGRFIYFNTGVVSQISLTEQIYIRLVRIGL